SLYIRGTAENFSDTDYEYVQLSFGVYDETDAKIADALANTSGLTSGQRWRFEALAASAENVSSYALTDITAY
ncbi:FxLYD domain-containing protein, partial [Halobacterium salinarum]|uniref:FxLYD domain-containing protein n=1 Tax=Halobacterium salinarum TaxID=2242 RepID=UPI00255458EF